MVGHKADLEDKRVVSTEEGINLAEEMGCSFFETSAKTRQNIDESMEEIVRLWRRFYQDYIDYDVTYLTGHNIPDFFENFQRKEFLKCETPSINKNLKHIWLNIFRLVLEENRENKNCLRLVCKHWYNTISQISLQKSIGEFLISKYFSIFMFPLFSFFCFLIFLNLHLKQINRNVDKKRKIIATTKDIPPINLIKKYVGFYDITFFLNNSAQNQLNFLRSFSLKKKQKLIVLFNFDSLKEMVSRNVERKFYQDLKDAKKVKDKIVKGLSSSFQVIVIDDLQTRKNIEKILSELKLKKDFTFF